MNMMFSFFNKSFITYQKKKKANPYLIIKTLFELKIKWNPKLSN